MANVKFDRKIFEKEIGRLTDEMQEKIALFGTPIESIDDESIELEIFPNRPDLLGYHGFKRSFLAFLGKKSGFKKYKVKKPEKNYQVNVESSVKNIRPFTACAIVKGLKLDNNRIKELVEIQEKLHSTIGRRRKKLAIGIYPLEKITLPISYKALEPDKIKFQPLESLREMSGLEILQKHPTGKEYSHLLAGKIKFPVFVDKEKNILSMPPIINSEKTGRVTTKTKDVFVECSGFDFNILEKCLNIVVTILSDMGGKIYQMKVKDKITPNLNSEKMNLSKDYLNRILGLNLSEKEVKGLLSKMGHRYENGKVEISPWRVDILHEIDLIEDVAIAYGYQNFESNIPKISTIGKENSEEILKRKFAEIFIGLKMLEVSNYHLTKKEDQFSKMGVLEGEKEFIELESSKTDYTIMRKDLKHYLLKIVSENNDSEYPQRIFEIGKVFSLKNKEIIEEERLGGLVTPGNFTDVLQILRYFFSNLELDFELKEVNMKNFPFIEGRVGRIVFEGKEIGFIGEIHPKILKKWKIKMPVSLFEIRLKEIFEKLK